MNEPTVEAVSAVRLLVANSATVGVAESLTGGLVGASLTDVPGASAVFRGGITAYATHLKASLLDVDPDLLLEVGPVHPAVAVAMADGVRHLLSSTYGLATTGVAGPEPLDGHAVGTVHVASAGPAGERVRSYSFSGERAEIRRQSVSAALNLLVEALRERPGTDAAP